MRKNKNNVTDLPLTISSKDGLVDQVSFFNKTVASKDMSGYYLLMNGEYAYNKSYSAGYDFGSIKRLDRYPMGALSTLYICFALKKHNSDFIKTYFDSLKWYKEIYMISAEGARNHGLLNVPTDEFFDTYHYITENEVEQEKIAKLMGFIERRIQKQQALVDNLKNYKRGAINNIFNGHVLPNEGKETTKECLLSDVATFHQGLTYTPGDVADSGSLVLRSSNIQNGRLVFRDNVFVNCVVSQAMTVKKNDILMCVRNGSKHLVGKTAIIDQAYENMTWGAFMMVIRSNLGNSFVYHYLNSDSFSNQVFRDSGTATINQITKGTLNECRLILPSKEIQEKICGYLDLLESRLRKEEDILEQLLLLKGSLLQQLFV